MCEDGSVGVMRVCVQGTGVNVPMVVCAPNPAKNTEFLQLFVLNPGRRIVLCES
jgi:hypothetical protein